MCGINGFTFADEQLIHRMNEKTKHRGPDDAGVFVDNEISLGHNRLAILDLTPTGAQPMKSQNGTVVVIFNGEIYNFQELRQELQTAGHRFRGTSDTEVIVRGYEAWGIDVVKRFNGIFAFALWDRKIQTLFLARDHVGVKPLYYFWNGNTLIFSSEIKAILEHPLPRAVNHEALNLYFRLLYVPAPLTMFQNIFKLEPGQILTYRQQSIMKQMYWNPRVTPYSGTRTEAIRRVQELLADAVRRQMISERPVGIFLSGGIDSTAVLGFAREIQPGIKTFSVGFDVAPEKFNADLRLAKETAIYYGTDHHELIVTGDDCARHFEDVVYHMDEPVANGTQIATYLLSKFARESGIVVALGGDGGDELFGGYERYRLSQMVTFYQSRIPFLTQSLFLKLMAKLPEHWRLEAEKMTMPPGVPRLLSFMAQKESDVARILHANDASVTQMFFANYFIDLDHKDPENELMRADLLSWLPDESLVRSDKLSMAFALEQRVPILDYRLIELSLAIPSAWKLKGETKSLFKEAVRTHIPEHIQGQPKRGWTSPASEWLRTSLKPMMEEVLSPSYAPGTAEFLNLPEIKLMYEDHVAKRVYHMNLLWAVLTFEVWYRQFIAQKR